MDAPRGLNEHDADKALRDLFRDAGPLVAPEGLDARIMQRIALPTKPALAPEKSLVPRWAWIAAIALLALFALITGSDGGTSPTWATRWMPHLQLDAVLGSPWLIMGLAGATALLALDTWLSKQRLVFVRR